jgi:hypothetical protein
MLVDGDVYEFGFYFQRIKKKQKIHGRNLEKI